MIQCLPFVGGAEGVGRDKPANQMKEVGFNPVRIGHIVLDLEVE